MWCVIVLDWEKEGENDSKLCTFTKLPVCTTEEGIKIIKSNIKQLDDWKELSKLIPSKFKKNSTLKRSGIAGLFSASLELTKEGIISIMQKNIFDKLLIKEKKWKKRKI